MHSVDARTVVDVMDQKTVMITEEPDISSARQLGRDLALRAGFTCGDQTVIDVVISEIGRNILSFAGRGQITLRAESNGEEPSIVVVACDHGPGIPDVALALVSVLGEGTTVTMKKWRRRHA